MQSTAGGGPEIRRRRGSRAWGPFVAIGLAGAALVGFLAPALLILLGVPLVVAVVMHACSTELRPFAETLLCVPIARPRRRRAHLALAAGTGLALIVLGALGASVRGRVLTRVELRSEQREALAARASTLLARARAQLVAGDLPGAELTLLEADAVVGLDAQSRAEIAELLRRVRLCGDPHAIRAILARLPAGELAALEAGTAVPAALELGDKALTYRAVETALSELERAREQRARR